MIAILTFSVMAALLVGWAGRRDKALDPRLTALALVLLAVFPLLWLVMPKFGLLPAIGTAAMSGPADSGIDVGWVLGGAWLLASMIASLRLILASRGLAVWRRNSIAAGREEGVEIRVLTGLKGPVAAGVFNPVIFVPDAWHHWSAEVRRIVIAHELAHHHRRDPLWRWIAQIACAVNPWNPLAYWMARRLALQCEHACDAAVLGKGISAGNYARLLCDFAESKPPSRLALTMATGSTLEARVQRMLHRPSNRAGAAGVVVLIALTLALAGGLASIGRVQKQSPPVTQREIETRFGAQAFPSDEAAPEAIRFAEPP